MIHCCVEPCAVGRYWAVEGAFRGRAGALLSLLLALLLASFSRFLPRQDERKTLSNWAEGITS